MNNLDPLDDVIDESDIDSEMREEREYASYLFQDHVEHNSEE